MEYMATSAPIPFIKRSKMAPNKSVLKTIPMGWPVLRNRAPCHPYPRKYSRYPFGDLKTLRNIITDMYAENMVARRYRYSLKRFAHLPMTGIRTAVKIRQIGIRT
jgi:hypothetical protein